MTTNFLLESAGYQFETASKIWLRPSYSSIAYSDGDEVEGRLADIIGHATDLSVFSTELSQQSTDWPSLYHLSSSRANILRPLESILLDADVLEVGAGCGAITRYLGETCANVVALEGSLRRASIARSRTRDLDNVKVVADRFNEFSCEQKFDVVTLIGVLEYANMFTPGDAPAKAMLERVHTFLKPGGKVIIAIENQLGLKYFAGAPEDHLGQPMYGIEGRYRKDQPQTFGRRALENILIQSGFSHSNFMAPFPDYKLPASIVTEAGFSDPEFDASALAWQSARRDPQLPPLLSFSPELAWPVIFDNALALDLANSFLVVASYVDTHMVDSKVLAYHYSTDRRAEYCKETSFIRKGSDDIRVVCRLLSSTGIAQDDALTLFRPEAESDYVSGTPLSREFIEIVSRDGWRFDDAVGYFKRYLDILSRLTNSVGEQIVVAAPDRDGYVRGRFIDATPQNIVCMPHGIYRLIDTEWQGTADAPITRLLFRSILWQMFGLTRFGQPAESMQPFTRWNFIVEIFSRLGLEEHVADFPGFLKSESIFQEMVTGRSAEQFMEWWPDLTLYTENLSLAVPQRNAQIASLNQAVSERDGQIASLNQVVSERDGQIASLNQVVSERDGQIASLNQAVAERDGQVASLNQAVAERDGQIASLNQAVAERDGQIASLNQAVAERDGQIASLNQAVAERDGQIASLNQAVAERDGQIASLNQAVAERDGQIAALYNSTSWKVTQPLRFVAHQMKRIRRAVELAMLAIKRGGGLKNTSKKAIQLYQREGLAGIQRGFKIVAASSQIEPAPDTGDYDRNDYAEWIRRYDTLTEESRATIRARIDDFSHKPLISVVMPVYNPPLNMLEDAIRSVQGQLYPNWELCIADDASTDMGAQKLLQHYANNDSRIKVVFRKKNGHISAASNSALKLANGEYIALLDNDDLLREQALFWVADAIVTHPDAGLIYSDEDKIDQSGRRYDPYFKSDWNPDLFLSHNIICHLGAYRTDLVRRLGGFREGYEGAQDYDLALRCTEQLVPRQIVHIPRVLYHWRSHPGSTAQAGREKNYALLAGERALNDHFSRTRISAKAELLGFGMYRVRYAIPALAPLVSLIIPTHNSLSLIKQCIEGILAKTTYKNYEILIVDNNSDDPKALAYFARLAENKRIRILRDERPFNYSALNNAAIQQARGKYVGLINNDIEVISPEWLEEMMSLAIQPGVGAVGARLWYPNETLQHGGCITGVGGVAGHSHKHLPRGHFGYFARAQLIQTLSVVTAACLVIKKSIYEEVGGLDETNLKVAFNDVDFCLRVREAGYRNVWTPYAELYHHESATRGYEDTPEKQLRFRDEVLYMQKRWGNLLMNDPAYSPNLTLDHEDFSYAWPPRINPI